MDEFSGGNSRSPGSYPQTSKASRGPIEYGWFGLGEGKGMKWALWPNSVTFQRQEKQGDKWITTEELHVAPVVLKEIAWRCGGWLGHIENERNKKKRGGV